MVSLHLEDQECGSCHKGILVRGTVQFVLLGFDCNLYSWIFLSFSDSGEDCRLFFCKHIFHVSCLSSFDYQVCHLHISCVFDHRLYYIIQSTFDDLCMSFFLNMHFRTVSFVIFQEKLLDSWKGCSQQHSSLFFTFF